MNTISIVDFHDVELADNVTRGWAQIIEAATRVSRDRGGVTPIAVARTRLAAAW